MSELKWTHMVPLLNRGYLILNLLFLILFIGGGLAMILFLVVERSMLLNALRLVIVSTGVVVVGAFMVSGFAMLEEGEMTYILSLRGVETRVGETTRLYKLIERFERIPHIMNGSMSAPRDQTHIKWGDIQQAVMDMGKRIVLLSSDERLLVRLHCTPDTYPKVVNYVEKMLPEAELKYL